MFKLLTNAYYLMRGLIDTIYSKSENNCKFVNYNDKQILKYYVKNEKAQKWRNYHCYQQIIIYSLQHNINKTNKFNS